MIASNNNCCTALKSSSVATGDLLKNLQACSQTEDDTNFSDAFSSYTGMWMQIGEDAGTNGLIGLQDVCMLFHEAVIELFGDGKTLDDQIVRLLEDWQRLFIAYLESSDKEDSSRALIQHLKNDRWINPLSDDDVDMLIEMLILEPHQSAGVAQESAIVTSIEQADSVEFSESDTNELPDFQDSLTISFKPVNPELIEMVRGEFSVFGESIKQVFSPDDRDDSNSGEDRYALREHTEKLTDLGRALDTIGLFGLNRVVDFLVANLAVYLSNERIVTEQEYALLKSTTTAILSYLDAVDDRTLSAQLVEHLKDPQWPKPLPESDADLMISLFNTVELGSDQDNGSPKKLEATAEDISLQISADVTQELLDSLLNELPILTSDFSAAVQSILNGGSLEDVETAQRIAHTLKGSGNIAGIKGIATITHYIEDILEQFAEHNTMPPAALSDALMNAADCLETMSDTFLGTGQAPENALEVLQEILDWANSDLKSTTDDAPVQAPAHATAPVETVRAKEEAADSTPEQSSASSSPVSMSRIPSSLIDDMMRLTGEGTILTGQVQEQLSQVNEQGRLVKKQNRQLQLLISELEQLVNIKGFSSHAGDQGVEKEFDPLEMDEYNELHSCTHRLMELATDSRELSLGVDSQLANLDDLINRQTRLQKENQELVLRTRMVPVKTIVSRCQRAIRQACRVIQKQVELNIVGEDTLMDSEVLNGLMDPLMHLLRNAVDHGIESSEQRDQAGKDLKGNVTLEFARKGNNIVVTCQDDGAGLDFEQIRLSAEKKGLIQPSQQLSEDELNRLILTPGFSTRSSATQISGRGIGMDAVRAHVLKMKGDLSVHSESGHGCRVELTLPATLVSVQALLIKCQNQLMAVSNRGLEQILYPGAGVIQRYGDSTVYQIADKVYPTQRLEPLLGVPVPQETKNSTLPCALLIKDESGETNAILVESVVDSRDLVVKNMGQYVPEVKGIVGATILGDGRITPVLDIPDLLGTNIYQGLSIDQNNIASAEVESSLPVALVVDDSLSARRSLAQFLQDTAGFEVITAIDGVDAIEKINMQRPAVLLVDMEMPRMNGIELTAHVRSREDIKDIPVIMITSRSTEKHKRQAETAGVTAYLTKPYAEEDLLQYVTASLEVA